MFQTPLLINITQRLSPQCIQQLPHRQTLHLQIICLHQILDRRLPAWRFILELYEISNMSHMHSAHQYLTVIVPAIVFASLGCSACQIHHT